MPYLKLYRVDYNKQGRPIGEEKEFDIPNFISEDDVLEIMKSGTGRAPGAGLKKFTWSLDGVQPAEVDNNISAEMQLYFQSVGDFFNNSSMAGQDQPTFLDLVIATPGATSTEEEPSPSDAVEDSNPPPATELTRRYDGARFRIKVVAGWSAPDNLAELYPNLGSDRAASLQEAIARQKTILFLQQTRHNIDFNQDGSLMMTIYYQASITGILTGKTANIFAPTAAGTAEEMEEKEKELAKLRKKKGSAAKKEIEALLKEYKDLQEKDRLVKYRKILQGLFRSGKIYNLAIDRLDLLEVPLADLEPEFRARRALKRQRTALEIRTGFGPENDVLLQEVSNAITNDGSAESAATATSERLTEKFDLLEKPGSRIIFASYFYLGDLIDNVLEQIKISNGGAALDFKFLLSEVSMIDPLQAFKIQNIDKIVGTAQNLDDAIFLETLYSSDPYNFSKQMGVTQLMNIGDIPISLDAFQIWFKDKVIKKGREKYYLLHFVKDVCADLITGALSSACFGPNYRFVQRFDTRPINLKQKTRKLAPNATVKVTGFSGLARMVTQVDDSTDIKNISLGLVLLSTDSKPKNLLGMKSFDSDISQGVYHHYLGSPCGLVKSINFSREDQPYLREAKIQKEGSFDAAQLRELYSADISLYGNTLYKNGNYIYINPALLGASQDQLRTLGLHGYYLVTSVKHEINERGFNVSLRALAEGQEFSDNKLIAPVTVGTIDNPLEPEGIAWRPPGAIDQAAAEQIVPTAQQQGIEAAGIDDLRAEQMRLRQQEAGGQLSAADRAYVERIELEIAARDPHPES